MIALGGIKLELIPFSRLNIICLGKGFTVFSSPSIRGSSFILNIWQGQFLALKLSIYITEIDK
jgi:hypothetical protein